MAWLCVGTSEASGFPSRIPDGMVPGARRATALVRFLVLVHLSRFPRPGCLAPGKHTGAHCKRQSQARHYTFLGTRSGDGSTSPATSPFRRRYTSKTSRVRTRPFLTENRAVTEALAWRGKDQQKAAPCAPWEWGQWESSRTPQGPSWPIMAHHDYLKERMLSL